MKLLFSVFYKYLPFLILLFILIIFRSIFKNNENPLLIIIPSDLYYFDIIKNFYITNIIKYNLSNIFIVVSYTNAMYIKCRENNIPVEIIDNPIDEDNQSYKITSHNFIRKTRLKHPIIVKYLKLCEMLLFLDADVYFFKNPISLISYFSNTSDLMMPCNDKQCKLLNYGYLLIRNTAASLKYFHSLIKIEKECTNYEWDYGEQGIANKYMRSISYIKIQKMTIDYFMDGYNFFLLNSFSISNKNRLIGFHNDFTIGIDSKIYRLKEMELYYYEYNYEIRKNKFIYYNGTTKYSKNNMKRLISYLLLISFKMNRTLILPKFDCNKKRKCTFVELFNLECFIKCGVKYKENISLIFFILKFCFILTFYSFLSYLEDGYKNGIKKNLIILNNIEIKSFNSTYGCIVEDDYWQKNDKQCKKNINSTVSPRIMRLFNLH